MSCRIEFMAYVFNLPRTVVCFYLLLSNVICILKLDPDKFQAKASSFPLNGEAGNCPPF